MPSHESSRRISLVACALLAAACGNTYSSSLSLELTSPGVNRSGEWKISECDGCFSSVRYGGVLGNYQWIAPYFEAPGNTEEESVAVTFDLGQGIGVGPLGPQTAMEVSISSKSGGTDRIKAYYGIVVDRLHYTGDPVEPWRADYVIDGPPGGGAGLKYKGRASLMPNCEPRDWDDAVLCGGNGVDAKAALDSFARTYAIHSTQTLPCPDEVRWTFVTQNQPMRGDSSAMTIRSGSAEPLSCVSTRSGGLICGGTKKNVASADGCSWNVDVVQGPVHGKLILTAKASGCDREVPYCNEWFE